MIKVAFIGAGPMATLHAEAFKAVHQCELTAVATRHLDTAESFAAAHGFASAFDDIDAMLDADIPDLVLVCVPVEATRDVVTRAARAGITLLIEKPAGLDLKEAETLVAKLSTCGVQAYVGLNRRYYACTLKALEILDADTSARTVVINDQQHMAALKHLGHSRRSFEHFMFTNSIHLIDYFNRFCRGGVDRVTVLDPWTGVEPSVVTAHISYDSGDRGIYIGLIGAPGPWAVSVSTPAQRLEFRPLESVTLQSAGSRRADPVDVLEPRKGIKHGLFEQARLAVAAAGGEDVDLPTAADALKTMRLIAAIYARD